MQRFSIITLVTLAAGAAACGGHPAPPPVSPVVADAGPAATPTVSDTTVSDTGEAVTLPPAPSMDSVALDHEAIAELRIAADSVADEAVLDQLADAQLDSTDADSAAADEPDGSHGGPAAAAKAVTFDIDVERFNSHNRVQYFLDFFQTTGRERMGVWLSRMPRYEAMIRRRLQAEGLPGDLVYLALIESGFSNTATSRARAAGMWQFMKGTARLYGLRIDRWVDERRDPYKATDAAVRHLKALSDQFGSYYLAAAAYNAGAGKVSRGLNHLDDEDSDSLASDATFFRLYDTRFLRRETKDYVPKLIAAAMIAKDPTRYGFPPDAPLDTLVPYDSLVVPEMTGLDVMARLADTTLAAIRELNPQYLRLVTPPGTESVVRLPLGRGDTTAVAYAALPASERVSFHEHVARSGETMSGIARHNGISERELAAANPRLRGRVRTGQLVIVPTDGALAPEVARQLAAVESAQAADYHRVRSGETLGLIAARYGVTQHQLVAWNSLRHPGMLRIGQRLRVSPGGGRSASRGSAHHRPGRSHTTRSHVAHTHVVRRGETLTGLARRYGVTVQALVKANGLRDDDMVRSGRRLIIPA
ncbi:MAG TPA: LysM peptidoglycan-binding domain-containing protein [Gemmatimonadales bacterium]|nr:LysM peptidoglycan-binding domain-containing protein [Gemmatimonadales bacterium]